MPTSKASDESKKSDGSGKELRGDWGAVFKVPESVPAKPKGRRKTPKTKTTQRAVSKSTSSSATDLSKAAIESEKEHQKVKKSTKSKEVRSASESRGVTGADEDVKPEILTEVAVNNSRGKQSGCAPKNPAESAKPTETTKKAGASRRSKSASASRSATKSVASKSKDAELPSNRQITDYFQVVRRSDRRTAKQIDEEQRDMIGSLVEAFEFRESNYFKVVSFDGKGRGVIAAKDFRRGEFVVEYAGDLIDESEARRREEAYARDESVGCYVYHFEIDGHRYCVDATRETGRIGRLINHSRREANLTTRRAKVPCDANGTPRLLLFAKRDIALGEEFLYDYGDRSRSALESHPWLKS